MEITPTTIILVGVVCVILGFLASVLVNTLTEEGDATTEVTEETPPGGRKGRYTPVFRVWREKGAGTMVVEMDGKSMVSPEPLNAVQRERLERTVRELRGWLGMGLVEVQPAQPEPTLRSEAAVPGEANMEHEGLEADLRRVFGSEQAIPAENPPVVVPPPVRSATPYSPPAQSGTAALQPAQAGKVKGKEEIVPAAARSIVMQIEDILQDMIAGTELETRGVHLMEDPIRGVVVQVGLENFEGIDAVPDPQIKGIIQSAVQTWEKTQ